MNIFQLARLSSVSSVASKLLQLCQPYYIVYVSMPGLCLLDIGASS